MATRHSKPRMYVAVLDTKDAVFFFLAPSDPDALLRAWVLLGIEKRIGKIPKAAFDVWDLCAEQGVKAVLRIIMAADSGKQVSDQKVQDAAQYFGRILKSFLEDHPNCYFRLYDHASPFDYGGVRKWPELTDKAVEQSPDIYSANGMFRLTAPEEEELYEILVEGMRWP